MQQVPKRLGLPNLGLGLGLRSKHIPYLLQNDPIVDWFEVISENYMDNHGFQRYALDQIAERVPLVMHGVSLSIGSTSPLNLEYLQKLKNLAAQLQPAWVSDHLCWTGINHVNTHDLLPIALTEESLEHVINRVKQVQDFLERPLILENPSTYLEYQCSTFTEWDFLCELSRASGCGLLLDVNNVYVSANNHCYDPYTYIHNLPHERIVQIHLAGPTDYQGFLIDTHDKPVPTEVWRLYKVAQELTGGVSTLLEWDADIPEYEALVDELMKAKRVMRNEFPQVKVVGSHEPIVSNPLVRTSIEAA